MWYTEVLVTEELHTCTSLPEEYSYEYFGLSLCTRPVNKTNRPCRNAITAVQSLLTWPLFLMMMIIIPFLACLFAVWLVWNRCGTLHFVHTSHLQLLGAPTAQKFIARRLLRVDPLINLWNLRNPAPGCLFHRHGMIFDFGVENSYAVSTGFIIVPRGAGRGVEV